jgi:hypothetical protein
MAAFQEHVSIAVLSVGVMIVPFQFEAILNLKKLIEEYMCHRGGCDTWEENEIKLKSTIETYWIPLASQ